MMMFLEGMRAGGLGMRCTNDRDEPVGDERDGWALRDPSLEMKGDNRSDWVVAP